MWSLVILSWSINYPFMWDLKIGESILLGYDATLRDKRFDAFRRTVVPSSPRVRGARSK